MNSFLSRVLAPGLRRAGTGFASPRKAAPPIMPPTDVKPLFEEVVEEPSALFSSPEETEAPEHPRIGPGREIAPLFRSEEPQAAAGGTIRPPEIPSQPASARPDQPPPAVAPFLEEKAASPLLPSEGAPIAEEKRKPTAEILSFEPVEFNPAIHPTLRRFQPTGPAAGNKEASVRLKPEGEADPPPAREIVWEVVPADPPRQVQREPIHQKDSRTPLKQTETGPSIPMQAALPGNRPSQTAKEEERPGDLFTKLQAAPMPPRGATLPRPGVKPQEEKGDLIIEQMEVRVVAEPERRPEPPKGRPRGPKGSGAWETAARYYLGKV